MRVRVVSYPGIKDLVRDVEAESVMTSGGAVIKLLTLHGDSVTVHAIATSIGLQAGGCMWICGDGSEVEGAERIWPAKNEPEEAAR